MDREVYRIPEFCERYAISRTTFYREVWSNRLNVIKRGRRTLIARFEAERWFINECDPERNNLE